MGDEDCLIISYNALGRTMPIMVIARPRPNDDASDNKLNYEIIRSVVGSKARELYESLVEDDD